MHNVFARRIKAPLLSVLITIAFLLFYNVSFWTQFAARSNSWAFMAAFGFLIGCLIFVALTLLESKYLFKPILIITFFIAALSAYAMDTYGYMISADIFKSIVETDSREVFDLLSWPLLKNMALFFVLPSCLLLWLRIDFPTFKIRALHLCIALILCVGNLALFGKHYATLFRNHKVIKYYINPIRPIYSMFKYAVVALKPGANFEFVELDPAPTRLASSTKPRLVVLVVGESDRATNHQINGYDRPTNPMLSKRNDIFSFNKVYSCGTETTVSVPCMFSAFRREDYTHSKGLYTENVLDLLQKSQVKVLWRDNDGGCKNVCDRVETHDFNEAKIKPYCNEFECHDEILLHDLQQYITANSQDKLIVLHKKGNHGPAYYRRYPQRFGHFAPTCNTNELQDCTNEQIINTYDNIVRYTDFFLDKLIAQLEHNNDKYQTALIYVSDHGESLGEKGVYLHAMPYWIAPKEQIHVPFIFWASPDFVVNRDNLAKMQQADLSHDHLFHSLLGLFGVKSVAYTPNLDIFKP